jgi:hypothetical protein
MNLDIGLNAAADHSWDGGRPCGMTRAVCAFMRTRILSTIRR